MPDNIRPGKKRISEVMRRVGVNNQTATDSVKPKTPQQKRAELDSITKIRREEIVRKKDSIMQRNAAASGQDMETYRREAQKLAKKKATQPQTNCMTSDGKKVKPVKEGCRY
jgi:hypothetical protein